MLANLLLGLLTMVACLLVQALLVLIAVKFYLRNPRLVDSPTLAGTFGLISAVMVLLVIGNFVQIAIWAAVFIYLGEFSDFTTAGYHSAVNFATLGYGDIVMSEDHRILGPMQSINGVLMVGVSTAVVMAALQNALQRTRQARDESQ
jgi:hypothetical protein